jgi:hypothetical protein
MRLQGHLMRCQLLAFAVRYGGCFMRMRCQIVQLLCVFVRPLWHGGRPYCLGLSLGCLFPCGVDVVVVVNEVAQAASHARIGR